MIVTVDSSALLAIVLAEPEADVFREFLLLQPNVAVSAFTVLEARVALVRRRGIASRPDLEHILRQLHPTVFEFDAVQSETAFDIFQRYGKGRHPARLNLGDCVSYALASLLDAPLLFKGEDFVQTDITPAIAAGRPPAGPPT